ncbi:3-deoxy-7-phosphoheptulonate synthase class II [Aliifodinibius sp. S!AR15-10]|uniref:class II 3-deoxy-7-phosphoheptulonate synthase n=1 Tax=Aliifodinibius sp. S!AR15-10 TaxID=2950437 RepID=UPI0028568CA3|nr:3-deoxy-7-phosphoheptulonate synthase class II [Aliifodinibius sp. S!AR15-10]MDR8391254.1 3-deoxy-7-phosphoheptulonate synthase class II [Aliifodinibius sp. S!AR15-10]
MILKEESVAPEVANPKDWSPASWQNYPIKQLPEYPDQQELEAAYEELRSLPPLITSWEVEALKNKLADVAAGNGFLLQGGDCAETFADCKSPKIVNLLKVLLQMSFILIHETGVPVVRIGRIAGQYAKPRSSDYEIVDGEKIMNYRGDLINSFKPDAEARKPNPNRLIEGYKNASLTLNFLRALADEGFADLHHPEYWELDFMKQNKYYKEYETMVNSIQKAVSFMESITPNQFNTLQKINVYTSHEALNLYYDSAQTRKVPRREGFYNLSSHMVWLGNRTRDIDGAHVEYFRGIRNPIGIKVGPPFEVDETLRLIEKLNPVHEAGKIVLISRFGVNKVQEQLPEFIQAVKREGFPVVWICDPMHGNTFSTDNDVKTRNFDDIITELRQTFAIHRDQGTYLGGAHLELTGDNVTECVGGAKGLHEGELHRNYETYCDPRLNYEQSLEMAFLLAKEWKQSYKQ